MADNMVFKINNLLCEYKAGLPVLRLRSLEIPAGKLVFIIGKSGIGKSTFIETLGLMNKTIRQQPETTIRFSSGDGQEHELKNSWDMHNDLLSEFRRRHFSFIFQNTNLMPNFTSGENMMFSLLIKGVPYDEAREAVLAVMERLHLDKVIFNKKTTEISGGQRQRLAFVRAVTADFTVLFGDEPTGNLDKNTAEELMTFLKEVLASKNRTAIIVSHDLPLAEKFADMIVPIIPVRESEERSSGDVLPENIISRSPVGAWLTHDGRRVDDASRFLNKFLAW